MNLQLGAADTEDYPDLGALFERTFSASESEEEGALVGKLARDLLDTTPPSDLHVFCAKGADEIVAGVIFSRMTFGDDPRTAFILSPMAVHPDHQNCGVGTMLIRQGLDHLKQIGVDIALTYGDPAYYGRFGFDQIGEDVAPAPSGITLSFPHGWLGQSLTQQPLDPLPQPAACAVALNDQKYW